MTTNNGILNGLPKNGIASMAGGNTHQALAKASDDNFDTTWKSVAHAESIRQGFVLWPPGLETGLATPVANVAYFSPIWFIHELDSNILGMYLRGSQTANTSIRAGLYTNVDRRPYALVGNQQIVTTAFSSVTAIEARFNIPQRPAPGLYWVCVVSQGSAHPPMYRNNGNNDLPKLFWGNGSVQGEYGWSLSGVTGTLPSIVSQRDLVQAIGVQPACMVQA